eukprot:gene15559-21653_t
MSGHPLCLVRVVALLLLFCSQHSRATSALPWQNYEGVLLLTLKELSSTRGDQDVDIVLRTSQGSMFELDFRGGGLPLDITSGMGVRVVGMVPPVLSRKLAAVGLPSRLAGRRALLEPPTSGFPSLLVLSIKAVGEPPPSAAVKDVDETVTVVGTLSAGAATYTDFVAGGVSTASSFSDSTSTQPRYTADTISVAVFIVDFCGMGGGPAASQQEIEDMLYSSDGLNLGDYYRECSAGKASLLPENVLVLGPIQMPCDAWSKGYFWSAKSCTSNDYYGWQFWIEEWAAKQDPIIDLSSYKHRVIVTPKGQHKFMTGTANSCQWTGMGIVGPVNTNGIHNGGVDDRSYPAGKFSYAWINGDFWQYQQGWFHEIGHNYNLGHAGTSSNEYGDYSSAMGYCCELRCMNPAQNWQLGWAQELANTLGSAQLKPAATLLFALPDQHLTEKHVLRVIVDWLPVVQMGGSASASKISFWLGYRVDHAPYDIPSLGRPGVFSGGVNIYYYPGTSQYDSTNTDRLAILSPATGMSWSDNTFGSDIVFRLLFVDGQSASAIITVCRKEEEYETGCSDADPPPPPVSSTGPPPKNPQPPT